MIVRFDDVCQNSDMELHHQMTDWLFEKFPDCEVIWAISPLVHSGEKQSQRVFPKIWNAYSDYLIHCNLNDMGVPEIHPKVKIATHGLIHCDHRLLTKEAQELSILLSLSLIGQGSKCGRRIFVPPFNKWNKNTEEICEKHGIELIKFEWGWKSLEFNKRVGGDLRWYLHAREWTFETFKKWFE